MPREGPCANPNCTDRESASGQWTYVPEEFCDEHADEFELEYQVSCVCKKRPCWRWCGKLPPIAQPGRKRVAADGGDGVPVGVALDALPRPPILVSIDEIWAERCAAPRRRACICGRGSAADGARPIARACAVCARRCVDVARMGAVARGNVLTQPRAASLEYCVHGKWRRTEDDANGMHGAWYVDVPTLVETFGASVVTEKLAAYAAAQAAARAAAIAAAEAAEAA